MANQENNILVFLLSALLCIVKKGMMSDQCLVCSCLRSRIQLIDNKSNQIYPTSQTTNDEDRIYSIALSINYILLRKHKWTRRWSHFSMHNNADNQKQEYSFLDWPYNSLSLISSNSWAAETNLESIRDFLSNTLLISNNNDSLLTLIIKKIVARRKGVHWYDLF